MTQPTAAEVRTDTRCALPAECCPICASDKYVDRKLKRFCARCGTLCETCCDGGMPL
ncbi:MAG TPA: hypothetical protein PKV72_03540 [Candidatus Peribacteria bacterium]|nr:hypothetical protein [Candidatus Peribacteria bacterium]